MKRTILFPCRLSLLLGALLLAACDVSLVPEESDQADEGIWQGKPIKQWLLQQKMEMEEDGEANGFAKTVLDQVGPEETELVPALVQLLKNDDDPFVRSGAARLLGQIGPNAKDATEALEDALVDPDKGVLKATLTAQKRIAGLKP
jgi:hypothetical protein